MHAPQHVLVDARHTPSALRRAECAGCYAPRVVGPGPPGRPARSRLWMCRVPCAVCRGDRVSGCVVCRGGSVSGCVVCCGVRGAMCAHAVGRRRRRRRRLLVHAASYSVGDGRGQATPRRRSKLRTQEVRPGDPAADFFYEQTRRVLAPRVSASFRHTCCPPPGCSTGRRTMRRPPLSRGHTVSGGVPRAPTSDARLALARRSVGRRSWRSAPPSVTGLPGVT